MSLPAAVSQFLLTLDFSRLLWLQRSGGLAARSKYLLGTWLFSALRCLSQGMAQSDDEVVDQALPAGFSAASRPQAGGALPAK